MDAFLLGDSANKRKHRNIVVEIFKAKIFFLKDSFRLDVGAWCFSFYDANPLILSDTIGKGEGIGMLP